MDTKQHSRVCNPPTNRGFVVCKSHALWVADLNGFGGFHGGRNPALLGYNPPKTRMCGLQVARLAGCEFKCIRRVPWRSQSSIAGLHSTENRAGVVCKSRALWVADLNGVGGFHAGCNPALLGCNPPAKRGGCGLQVACLVGCDC